MRKASEIIRMAKDDPRYLSGNHMKRIPYLCHVVHSFHWEGTITPLERDVAIKEIEASLGGFAFLRTLLRSNGVIPHNMSECYPGYIAPAHKHWDNLILKLQEDDK